MIKPGPTALLIAAVIGGAAGSALTLLLAPPMPTPSGSGASPHHETGGAAPRLRDGPAARAGLRPGDVVTRIDDRDVATVQDLLDAVAGAGPDVASSPEVWRGSERIITHAATDTRPPPAE